MVFKGACAASPVLDSVHYNNTILSWGRSLGFGFLHTASIELNGSCYAVSTFRQWPLRTNATTMAREAKDAV